VSLNLDAIWHWLRDAVGTGIVAFAVYLLPPIRKLVDEWLGKKVAHHFDKQLEDHKHRLELIGDGVRAEYQRLLQNSAIVAERKHEVYRRLFRLLHAAMGRVVRLFGATSEPAFDAYSLADLDHYMTVQRFPGTVKDAVLAAWATDRKAALAQLRRSTRDATIEEAARAYARAWNYFLANALYLPVPIEQKVHEAFVPLEQTLILAKTPGATGDYITWRRDASDRVEELKVLLRAELRVVDEGGDNREKKG
jgi:hypothetical protein